MHYNQYLADKMFFFKKSAAVMLTLICLPMKILIRIRCKCGNPTI